MSELSVQTRRLAGVASGRIMGADGVRLATRAWTLVALGAALVIYTLTAAPDLTWAHGGYDGGDLITASYTLGIPHPTGYPTYVLLGKLFSILPLDPIAFRYHLLSAVALSIAVALLAWTLMSTGNRPLAPPAAAAIALGIALLPAIWSQATIAEVYGLNLALVAAFLFALLVLKRPFVTGLCFGLALTTHATSLLLLPLALALTPRSNWPRTAAGMGAGLLPLLLLPLLASSGSPVIWGDPTTVGAWWWLVSGRLYTANLGLPALDSWFAFPGTVAASIVIAVAAALVALNAGLLRATPAAAPADRRTILLALTATAYAFFVLLYRVPDASVFLSPAYLLLALCGGPWLGRVGWWLWLLPLALLVTGWEQHNLRDEAAVRPYAETVLQAAPDDAILLTPGDRTIFTLWYFHHVEGIRPDLALVDTNLFAFDWYRSRLGSSGALTATAVDDIDLFATTNGAVRPVCRASLVGANGQPVATLTCESLTE